MLELITGHANNDHVDSCDVGAYNAYTMGSGAYILDGCQCTMTDPNKAHISPGEILVEGRFLRILGTGEDVIVENGTQGQKRHDIIAIHYEMGAEDVEVCTLAVLKGVPSSSTPNDPAIPPGSILLGDSSAYHALYRVAFDGVNVSAPIKLAKPWRSLVSQAAYDAAERAKLLLKSGGEITGTLVLSNKNDAMEDSYNYPALVVGGKPTEQHIEIDGNEIMSKSNESTAVDLVMNNGGADLVLGGGIRPKIPVAVACGGTGGKTPLEAADNLLAQSIARATAIPISADLNTYRSPGNFVSQSAEYSGTHKNCPVEGSGYRLTVWGILGTTTNGGTIGQDLVAYTTGRRWWRYYAAGSGWSGWTRTQMSSGETDIYLDGGAGQKYVRFVSTSDKTHNTYIYGGNSSSATAIGIFDAKNERLPFIYNDEINKVYIGSDIGTTVLGNDSSEAGTQFRGRISGHGSYGASSTMYKRLWSGTLAPGGFATVPGISTYNVIMCINSDGETCMIGARNSTGGTIIRCSGAHDFGAEDTGTHGTVRAFQASFTLDGDKVTNVGSSYYYLLDGHNGPINVGSIWGIL